MNGTSTDATYVVDPAESASTRLSGLPESAWNTTTGTATPTLRGDLPQSPTSPSINGDPSTLNRVRPNLTINPHALPIEHRPRADQGHILTPHTHFYDSPGNGIVEVLRERGDERALRPSPSPASNIGPANTNNRQSTASRPSVGIHGNHTGRLSDPHCINAFGGREAPEALVSSPNGRLRGGSTSPKVPKARKQRAHWTDALQQPVFEPPLFVPAPEHDHVLPELSFSSLIVPFPEDDNESVSGVPTPVQDPPSQSSSSLADVRTRISLVTLPQSSTVTFRQPSGPSPAEPPQNSEPEAIHLQPPPAVTRHGRGLSLPKRVLDRLSNRFVNALTQRGRQDSPQSQQDFDIAQAAQVNARTAWHLINIRSNFPTDLTGYVVREGEEPFSSGGFGDIYRGTLRMSGRSIDVAVKAIRTYSFDDGGDTKREKSFRREIKTWLKLDHNNVVPLFGTTMNFGRFPAMVCPWLENGSLTSYLARPDGNLTTAERFSLVRDVAAGLQYLHSRSVVHGDLSGPNVLVDAKGTACISDFGLATLLTELGSTFATSHQHPGTLRWTAPELLELHEPEGEDNPPHIIPSPQSDVYSFGRIMLQILTGKVPFHYWNREAQVMSAIHRGMIPQRPRQEIVTDRQWSFMQRCWTPVDAGELRPCVDEIVEFVKDKA